MDLDRYRSVATSLFADRPPNWTPVDVVAHLLALNADMSEQLALFRAAKGEKQGDGSNATLLQTLADQADALTKLPKPVNGDDSALARVDYALFLIQDARTGMHRTLKDLETMRFEHDALRREHDTLKQTYLVTRTQRDVRKAVEE